MFFFQKKQKTIDELNARVEKLVSYNQELQRTNNRMVNFAKKIIMEDFGDFFTEATAGAECYSVMINKVTMSGLDDSSTASSLSRRPVIYSGNEKYIYIPKRYTCDYTSVYPRIDSYGFVHLIFNNEGLGMNIDSNNRIKCKELIVYMEAFYKFTGKGKISWYEDYKTVLGEPDTQEPNLIIPGNDDSTLVTSMPDADVATDENKEE